jgi:hypothetical protein
MREGPMGRTAAQLLLAMSVATVACAQGITMSLAAYGPLGVGDLDGDLPTSGEFRLTVPATARLAIEPFATVSSRRAGMEGLFGVQLRQRVAQLDDRGSLVFATYGAAAYYSGRSFGEGVFGVFGLGLHQRLTGYLAFRPEVQLVTFHVVPIGARLMVGLSLHRGEP